MALTKDDIQLIREALQPEFNQLRNELSERFDTVDQKLEAISSSIDDLVTAVTVDSNERYSGHEERIQTNAIPSSTSYSGTVRIFLNFLTEGRYGCMANSSLLTVIGKTRKKRLGDLYGTLSGV